MNREDICRVRELGFGSDYENLYAALVCFAATNNCNIENIGITDMQLQRLMTGRIPANISLDDMIAARNMFATTDYILKLATQASDGVLSAALLKELHLMTCAGLARFLTNPEDLGQWKSLPNAIRNAEENTAAPDEVEDKIEDLLDKWNDIADRATIEDIAAFHIAFEKIHPFLDGNGRVGRLIMFYQLVACGLHAAVIEKERAQEYFAALSLPDDEATRTLTETIRAEAEVFDSAYNIL